MTIIILKWRRNQKLQYATTMAGYGYKNIT